MKMGFKSRRLMFCIEKTKIFRYLALVAATISEADYVFIPESPPPNDWAVKLCNKLTQARERKTEYIICQ